MWAVCFVAILALLLIDYVRKRFKYPIGPLPLPILGNILELRKHGTSHAAFAAWRSKYGPIFTYWLGPFPVVAVNRLDLIQELLVENADNFSDRPIPSKIQLASRGGNYGIIHVSGPMWKEQRRFTMHALRNIGMGRPAMQEMILSEAAWLVDELRSHSEKPFDPMRLLERTVCSVINVALFGYRFDERTVEDFNNIRNGLDVQSGTTKNPLIQLAVASETLRKIPFIHKKYEELMNVKRSMFEFFERNIEQHRVECDLTAEPSDVCHAYLAEMAKQSDDGTFFTDKQLSNICFDLWLAGMETTAATMAWGLLFLQYFPEAQKEVHDELDAVIGSDRQITFADRHNLPRTLAFIAETQRRANILGQNLVRKAKKDVVLNGVRIPEGSLVMPNLCMLLSDSKVFPEPEKFNIHRFLDEDKKFKKIDEFIPFSLGSRACLGESIARTELFLFFANMLNQFQVLPLDAHNLPSLERGFSSPKPSNFQWPIYTIFNGLLVLLILSDSDTRNVIYRRYLILLQVISMMADDFTKTFML